jgi:alpha-tubulin N-acetyltransferase 1
MLLPGVRELRPNPTDHIATVLPSQVVSAPQSLIALINELGAASSRAQGLAHIITTFSSFRHSGNKLYILVSDDGRSALGFLKVGVRHLFLWDRAGKQHELQPLCLLDFFTFPSEQRKGYGRRMIDRMLREEGLEMRAVPIDRPSNLCLRFMKKHFGFSEFLQQANNFVVFDEFWGDKRPRPQPMTPVRGHPPERERETPPHARTPGARRSAVNPITWLPYD